MNEITRWIDHPQPPEKQALAASLQLTEISRWIDESPANASRTELEALLLRFVKIAEEMGEATAEFIGMTGQNPRKGVTSDLDAVIKEALDVVLTALGFVEHATGNKSLAFGMLFEHIAFVHGRALNKPSSDVVASDVKIDKFLDATETVGPPQ